MKKKLIASVVSLVLLLTACGQEKTEDLTGTWQQSGTESADSYQEAVIFGDTIEIYWVADGGDTKSLYWAGSYEAPEKLTEPYSWDSVNDKEKTDSALLASGDDTKTFTFEDGVLSYSVSAFGTTTTMKLEKKSDSVAGKSEEEVPSSTAVPESAAENGPASSAAAAVEMETVTLDGVSFQYDPQYSYDAANKTLSFEKGKAFVNVLQIESMAGALESSESADNETWLNIQHQSFLSGFSLTEEVDPQKIEISGQPALRSNVTIPLENDMQVSYDLVTFYAGDYCYGFAYASTGDQSEYAEAFQQVLDSIEIAQ